MWICYSHIQWLPFMLSILLTCAMCTQMKQNVPNVFKYISCFVFVFSSTGCCECRVADQTLGIYVSQDEKKKINVNIAFVWTNLWLDGKGNEKSKQKKRRKIYLKCNDLHLLNVKAIETWMRRIQDQLPTTTGSCNRKSENHKATRHKRRKKKTITRNQKTEQDELK